ncbi:helix-turn-helix domain-containing protein [Candidatus Methanocrinis alkalitolerans]
MLKAFKYRIYPTKTQRSKMEPAFRSKAMQN